MCDWRIHILRDTQAEQHLSRFFSLYLLYWELETILKDARTILKSAGIAKADADEIAEDLKTIATEVRSSAAN